MTMIAERVAAGAAFLDERDPDWWRADVERAIDLDGLDLSDTEDCVLGQRCPLEALTAARRAAGDEEWSVQRYDAYAGLLLGVDALDGRIPSLATAMGFAWAGSPAGGMEALTAEWKRVIKQRRAAS